MVVKWKLHLLALPVPAASAEGIGITRKVAGLTAA